MQLAGRGADQLAQAPLHGRVDIFVAGGKPDLASAPLPGHLFQPGQQCAVLLSRQQPGGGFSVAIDSVKTGQEGALTVVYSLATPDPKAGGTTALTYPYVVARVHAADADPAKVQFSGPF